jgi:hypothetical protein
LLADGQTDRQMDSDYYRTSAIIWALTNVILDAGVMEAITKGPAFGDRELLHAYVLS